MQIPGLFSCVLLFFLGVSAAQQVGDVTNGCATCSNLGVCNTLEGLAIPDRIFGYTRDSATDHLPKQGSCMDMDRKATEVALFGPEYQFKNTTECRSLVNKYNCLVWASKNNDCPGKPKPPCRSLCVEVADKCVFMHLYRYYLDEVCARIPCAYTNVEECTPGQKELVQGHDRCDLHQYREVEDLSSFKKILPRIYMVIPVVSILLQLFYH